MIYKAKINLSFKNIMMQNQPGFELDQEIKRL